MKNNYKIAKIVLIVIAVLLVTIETIFVVKIVAASRAQKVEKQQEKETAINESIKALEDQFILNDKDNEEKDKELIKKLDGMKNFRDYDIKSTLDDFETIKYGKYPQNDKMGSEYEDIEWFLLGKENGFALLLSKNIIDIKKYNETNKEISWENSDIRKWLNTEFYENAFNDYEKEKIANTPIVNLPNIMYKTSSGNNTADRVEILSESEALVYLTIKQKGESLSKYATKESIFAKEKSIFPNAYWLRSTGSTKTKASYISKTGEMVNKGLEVDSSLGVRPTIWVQYKILHKENDTEK